MIQLDELIQRWANVDRVLDAMPTHERLKHWDMSTWGAQTECGTVACAAGKCGLDPWFRERGFTLDFLDGNPEISDVETFFGTEGSTRIFLNAAPRAVETVIEEVRAYAAELQRMAAIEAKATTPAIGEAWPEQGGVYAGARVGRDGHPDYLLIVGPEHDGGLNWADANAWAASLNIAGHQDFALPSRDEQQGLFDRVRDLFEREWYWSGEQHASSSSLAWSQDFDNGDQHLWPKDNELRARAVRRLAI